jgi:hypothetical protein
MRPARPLASLSPTLRDSARVAAWALGLTAGNAALAALLEQHRAGSLAAQAFVVEWGAGRLGVAWSDPDAPVPSAGSLIRRVGLGLSLGVGAALFVVAFAWGTGAAHVTVGSVSLPAVVVGVVAAIFTAVRDELLLRGLVLRAFRHSLAQGPMRGVPAQLAVCGLVAAAARGAQLPDGEVRSALVSVSGLATLTLAGLAGASFATLWLRDRGAWVACAAHAAWVFATTTAVSGSLLDVRWTAGAWGGGAFESSVGASLAVLAITAVAALTCYRGLARTG